MKDTALTRKRQKAAAAAQERVALDAFARSGISVMGGVSAIIGIWAAACFIGGLISAGGPVELAYSWFKAVAGL